MDTPLLRTKLYVPPLRRDPSTGPGLVARPRLIERLNAGLRSGRKLSLISAPAGFGKTTLVSEWIDGWSRDASRGVGSTGSASDLSSTPSSLLSTPCFSWLSLDESDNDLTRFLTYLIAALQTVEADIGKGVLVALQSPQPPPAEAVLTALINEIAAIPDPVVLVLDDYHVIETQSIHDTFAFLLEHLPPAMHLVIGTREDPPLSLARLRARGQLTELRATDLRFTSSEAAAFLNQAMGLELSAEDIAALETRTEGWIAGLQLAAISMQGSGDAHTFTQSFTGSHRHVLDYLIQEVFEQQTDSTQSFLLYTSILDRLTGSLCDAVCGASCKDTGQKDGSTELRGASCRDTASGQQTLEMLERANLFVVPLDNERRWYRYHHLFVDLLRRQLHQTQPDQVSPLHQRAGKWYGQNGFTDEAIEHVLRSEDFEQAADWIEEYVDGVWQLGEQTKLRRWLDKIPSSVILSRPHLCILYAGSLYISGEVGEAERFLQAAESTLDASTFIESDVVPQKADELLGPVKMRLVGRAAVMQSHLVSYHGDVQGAIRYARRALVYLPKGDATWRWSAFDSLGTAYSGVDDASAYRARSEALQASKGAGNAYMTLLASLRLVVTLRNLGRLQQATEVCQRHLDLASENGLSQTALVGWLYALWGEILAEKNELDRALEMVDKGVELTEQGQDVILRGSSYLCLMRVLFSRGDMDRAQELVHKVNRLALTEGFSPWIVHQMAARQARVWVAQDKLNAASFWAQEAKLDIDGDLVPMHDFGYRVLARLLIAQERFDEASKLLARLLQAAEAGGRISKTIELLSLQALAFQARGDMDRATASLDKALTLAEPGGYIRTFVDEGPPMARLLYKAATRGIAPDYVRRLLAAFPGTEPEPTDTSKTQDANAGLIEPLSERELEILEHIAEGLTNPEIASRLYLSLNTVKVHTRNIYGKLGVHNRTQAVAQARALGLLTST